jgi:hypothetical protein
MTLGLASWPGKVPGQPDGAADYGASSMMQS